MYMYVNCYDVLVGYVTTRFWRAPEVLLQWMHYDQKGVGSNALLC